METKEKVKNFAEALQATGRPELPKFEDIPEDLRIFFQSVYKVVVINEALNNSKRFNIYDSNVNRYYPWFLCRNSPSSFGFDATDCDNTNAYAGGGSRLCLENRDLARYAGMQFKDEYREMLES